MKIKHLFLLSFFIILFALNNQAQNRPPKGTVGLGASLQSGQYDITVPFWIGEKTVLVPSFLVNIAQGVGTDFGIALAPRYYLSKGKLAPYVTLRAGVITNVPSADNEAQNENLIDWIGGIGTGGEYFVSPQFSIGVEAQGNVTNSDARSYRFGNPGNTNFNLSTSVSVNIYFMKDE
ncbi:MAG: hypothetical protein K9I94_02100 [Bacteroidales bacterium]|nr:hypothetical protein [Bacteroidales bacterium]